MMDKNNVAHEVRLAYHLQNIFCHALQQDEKVRALLVQLDQNIEATQKEMVAVGVIRECADCAVNGEGTCCGKRTGYKYDSVILLVNLLLGKTIPLRSQDPHACYFLTQEGCILRARHVICVNFVCPRLRNNIQQEMLIHVQGVAGKELDTLFLVEEHIKKKIGSVHSSPDYS
jgi:hypothetical protein